MPSFLPCLFFFFLRKQALGEDTHKYVDVMQRVVNREETVVELEIDDVLAVSEGRAVCWLSASVIKSSISADKQDEKKQAPVPGPAAPGFTYVETEPVTHTYVNATSCIVLYSRRRHSATFGVDVLKMKRLEVSWLICSHSF